MGTLGWLLVVAVALALGYFAGRRWPGSTGRISGLERERDTAREDLERYRRDVSTHFEHTAQLFDQVTSDYRSLYEHLAVGSRQLGAIRGEPAGKALAQPEARQLASDSAGEPLHAPPTADLPLDPGPVESGEPEREDHDASGKEPSRDHPER